MRGDLYRLRPAKDAAGHEQRGPRYAVAVQSDAILLSTLIVAPTSSRRHRTLLGPLYQCPARAGTGRSWPAG